jgi:casein kinase II subunit alpha
VNRSTPLHTPLQFYETGRLADFVQLISLIWGLGWHIFKPDPMDAGPDDEAYPSHVLVKQIAFFGPFPLSYFDFLPNEDERWDFIGDATQYIIHSQKWKPFAKTEDKELDVHL